MRYRDAPQLPEGLEPIPIAPATKKPAMVGWRRVVLTPGTVERLAQRFADCAIATRLGQLIARPGRRSSRLMALDIDVLDPEIAEALYTWLVERLGPLPRRWGQRPKFAVLLLLDSEQRPRKRLSTAYRDFLEQRHRIELLVHKVMLYGPHPIAGEYTWSEPLTTLDTLPVCTQETIDALFEYFDQLASERGWERLQPEHMGAPVNAEDALAQYRPPLDISTEELRLALDEHDPDDGYDAWLRVGMALHHQYEGREEGFELWDDWSQSSAAYDEEELRAKWHSFSVLPGGRAVTVRSLVGPARVRQRKRAGELNERMPPAEVLRMLDRRQLPDGNEGAPIPGASNLARILRHDDTLPPCWLNELTLSRQYGERALEDSDPVRLKLHIAEHYRFEPSTALCREALELACDDTARHPVREYLASLTWDGGERLDTWLPRYLGVEDEPYIREIGRKTLVAAVARVFVPGTKWDHMLILEGPQERGKSSAIHALSPNTKWTADIEVSREERRMQEIIQSAWLIEFGELRGLSNADVRLVKAFLSRTQDTYRGAYARYTRVRPRQAVFFGTTNDSAYLQDETGNRRFLPVRITGADLPALIADRDQLWAEAVIAYHEGEILEWTPETRERLTGEQIERVEYDDWEEALATYLATLPPETDRLRSRNLAHSALGITVDRFDIKAQKRLARAMSNLGWERATMVFVNEPDEAGGEATRTTAKGYRRMPSRDEKRLQERLEGEDRRRFQERLEENRRRLQGRQAPPPDEPEGEA